jgi:hypothetical protein
MKINEVVIKEGVLDAIKFLGRAAWQAAGGNVDKSDPAISRANLEYVRSKLANEIYQKFVGELIKQGILNRNGKLTDPGKSDDIINMAKEFLKQAYRAYIVTPERLNLLDTKIDNSAPTSLSQLRSWFAGVNSFYLEMLEQVEQTTASSTREIISQMATGINSNLPDQLRDLIKDLLKNMASKSSYALTIPWSNTRLAANAIRAAGTARGNPVTTEEITLYDESLKAIMLLRQQDKLNYALAAKFARSIS